MICHLHVHNEFSILDGFGKAEDYLKRAKELGQSHLALTNHGNIDGFLDFQSAAKKAGIKPVFGCELYVVPDCLIKDKIERRFHMTALIKNDIGFQNLCRILTRANLQGFYYRPRTDFKTILEFSEGLVFLTGCSKSPLALQNGRDFLIQLNQKNPDDFYLEIMPHDYEQQKIINKICLDWKDEFDFPLVATNDCHYIKSEDANLHEVLLAIQTKAKWNEKDRFKFEIGGLHLRSEEEMAQAFLEQGQLTKAARLMALRNTMEVAEKCSSFEIKRKDVWLPKISGLDSSVAEEAHLEFLFEDGYKKIFCGPLSGQYYDRCKEEFELICNKKFVRYFLLVHELIQWCKKNDIMTGPGRGSVGGSLIAYLIGITNVDPIKYNLLFSRFIDENRIDYPDVDIDFEDVKRPLIRQHLEELYGKNNIASVSTFMKMKGRAVIRDVSRVFDVPYKDVDEFAKAIFDEDNENNSVEQAAKETKEGAAFSKKYPSVVDYAIRLEGQIRGCSQHAAALIVSAEDLTQGTRGNLAVRSDQEVVNWSKDDAEYMGLMKLDILGLSTLSILNEAKRLIKKNHNKEICFESIDLNNKQVFEMLSRGETVGVFQFNTWATTKLVKQIGIESFESMGDVVALVRPGPYDSGMTADFIKRKHGTKWKKKHPIYEEITKDTFGIIVYQEQVMQVINLVAGLPYSTADKIRKIIGKKRDAKEFKPYKDAFVEGCLKSKTFSKEEADEFWEALQNHARYSFNKSHSVEYAMISYWCAWLKLYFPAEFLCANLTFVAAEKKEEIVKEAQRVGLNVVLPRIGVSDAKVWTVKDGNIYVPFIEVKGIGEKTAEDCSKYKQPAADAFFDLGKAKPTGKIGKLMEAIGADGSPPKDDISKYFSFDVSTITNKEQKEKECYFIQKRWRNPENLYCKDCQLRTEAKQPVLPSCGIYNVFIIGEAPGRDENEEGKGFVGKAGDLLWKELFKYGLTRRQFHVTNTCKCYPGNIRTPKAEHISACSKWLDAEIKNANARLCLALGNTPLKYFKGIDGGITKLSGSMEWIENKGIWVCWGLHPSAVLHRPENKMLFEEGIRSFADKIKSMGGFK